jgi:hypothetical protein
MKPFILALCSFSALLFTALVNAAVLNVFVHVVSRSTDTQAGNIPVREYCACWDIN